ncbi:hypothetical protein ACWC5I_17460 [Kitasatospora sp. NPDC001574]
MATHDGRIRTHKPEMSRDSKLARVSLSAERTFMYLFNYVDDKGRHIDDAGIVRGLIWKRKPSWDGGVHTSERVEDDLRQLTDVGLVCRYVNPADDGEELLHVVTFNKHQRIDKPSASRLAPCPLHQTQEIPADKPAPARKTRKATDTGHGPADEAPGTETGHEQHRYEARYETSDAAEPRHSTTPSTNGSRITDPGSTPPGGGSATPDAPAEESDPTDEQIAAMHPHATGTDALLAEYLRTCPHPPTRRFRGHLAREIRQLLGAGYSQAQVRAGLQLLARKPMSPGALEGFVQEAIVPGRPGTGGRHRAWTNPAAGAAAYAGEL